MAATPRDRAPSTPEAPEKMPKLRRKLSATPISWPYTPDVCLVSGMAPLRIECGTLMSVKPSPDRPNRACIGCLHCVRSPCSESVVDPISVPFPLKG